MRPRLAAPLLAVLALGLGGCSRADEEAADTGSTTLTVYVSLPFQGPAGPDSEATANGAKLALQEAHGKVGDLVIKVVTLDDSTAKTGRWNPEQTADNARTALHDRTAIAYVGDGPSGATAISLPILNSAGIVQVTPTSGYQGLTQALNADKGEPEKYYPSGVRTLARPVPDDDVQARAAMAALRERNCRRVQLLDDRDVSGRGLLIAVDNLAVAAGLTVVGEDELRAGADPGGEAKKVAKRTPDCAVYAGGLTDDVPPLFDALHAADPALELFGSDDLASDAFAAALDAGTQARTQLLSPPGVLEPLPGIKAFARRYRRAFAAAPRTGSIYGYEAMRLALAAIRRAGALGNNRAAVGKALFELGVQHGPLGTYTLDRAGDTSSTAYSRLGIRNGRLVRLQTGSYPAG